MLPRSTQILLIRATCGRLTSNRASQVSVRGDVREGGQAKNGYHASPHFAAHVSRGWEIGGGRAGGVGVGELGEG